MLAWHDSLSCVTRFAGKPCHTRLAVRPSSFESLRAEALKSSYSDQAASLLGPIIEMGSRGIELLPTSVLRLIFLRDCRVGSRLPTGRNELPPDSSKQAGQSTSATQASCDVAAGARYVERHSYRTSTGPLARQRVCLGRLDRTPRDRRRGIGPGAKIQTEAHYCAGQSAAGIEPDAWRHHCYGEKRFRRRRPCHRLGAFAQTVDQGGRLPTRRDARKRVSAAHEARLPTHSAPARGTEFPGGRSASPQPRHEIARQLERPFRFRP